MQTRREFIKAAAAAAALPVLGGCFGKKELTSNPTLAKLYKTTPFDVNETRLAAFAEIQAAADECTKEDFDAYRARRTKSPEARVSGAPKAADLIEDAAEKILAEIGALPRPDDFVRLWLVYNMGYIVQTPTSIFGIDISVPCSRKIADKLDFLLITHNHTDHFDNALIKDMGEKPVVANFIENKYQLKGDAASMKFGNIEIAARLVDHGTGKKLKKFVNAYDIVCADTSKKIRIFHAGDAGRAEELATDAPVDIFIGHVSVGLKFNKAVELTKPKLFLMSHLLELSHHKHQWRWSLQVGLKKCAKVEGAQTVMPMWGEKIEFKKA